MSEINVSDYQILSNAVSTTNTYKQRISEVQTSTDSVKQIISNQSVFMGPIADNCIQEFGTLTTDLTTMTSNFTTMSAFIDEANTAYKAGDASAAKTLLNGGVTSANSATALSSGDMRSFQYRGQNFNVVNTKTPIENYEQYVQSNGLYQTAGLLGGQCMLLSQYYAKDLLTGKNTSKSTMRDHGGSPAVRMNERCKSANPQDVLNYTYSELTQGHPVVLQVSQIHSDRGARHLVTAVGYDSSVTQASELTPDKILVLDCVDGKIQTLGLARSEGGHERRLFAQTY